MDMEPGWEEMPSGTVCDEKLEVYQGVWKRGVKDLGLWRGVNVVSSTPLRWPILSQCPILAGYDLSVYAAGAVPLTPGEGYGFVRVGRQSNGEEDEFFSRDSLKWKQSWPHEAGLQVLSTWNVIRRKLAFVATPTAPPKWSCRHKRVEGEKRCSVCVIMFNRNITD